MIERFYLDKSCPICSQGRLFIVEDTSNQRLFIHCEECECAWLNPDEIVGNKSFLAINPDFETRNPIYDTIQKFGWTKFNLKSIKE